MEGPLIIVRVSCTSVRSSTEKITLLQEALGERKEQVNTLAAKYVNIFTNL